MVQAHGNMSSAGANTFAERVNGLSDVVATQRSRFDSEGRLPDDLFDELAALGLFRLWLPAALGGAELSALEFMDVVESAAALDGTIGWLAGNGGGMSRVGAFISAESAQEIFTDPAAFVVSSTGALGRAVRVAGGYSVSGRWPFGSCSPHGTWFSPICEIDDNGPTGELIFVLTPRRDVVLHDNWQVSGLCATASVDFELCEVFVADRFAHRFQPEPTRPGTLYRLPTRSIFTFTVATVPLGIARGAIDDFVKLASSAKRSGDSVPLVERELIPITTRPKRSTRFSEPSVPAAHHYGPARGGRGRMRPRSAASRLPTRLHIREPIRAVGNRPVDRDGRSRRDRAVVPARTTRTRCPGRSQTHCDEPHRVHHRRQATARMRPHERRLLTSRLGVGLDHLASAPCTAVRSTALTPSKLVAGRRSTRGAKRSRLHQLHTTTGRRDGDEFPPGTLEQ